MLPSDDVSHGLAGGRLCRGIEGIQDFGQRGSRWRVGVGGLAATSGDDHQRLLGGLDGVEERLAVGHGRRRCTDRRIQPEQVIAVVLVGARVTFGVPAQQDHDAVGNAIQ